MSAKNKTPARLKPGRRFYVVAMSRPVLGRRIPVQIISTYAMPNWEEEKFGVALKPIWYRSCCIATTILKILYLSVNFGKPLLFNAFLRSINFSHCILRTPTPQRNKKPEQIAPVFVSDQADCRAPGPGIAPGGHLPMIIMPRTSSLVTSEVLA